jgi:hypothetical protein
MPRYTQARIRELCKELQGVKSDNAIEEILAELRELLREHVKLARTSLEGQLASLSTIEDVARR